jgi:hypothetical protein
MKEGRLVPFETGPRMQRLIYWNPEAEAGECIGDRCAVVVGNDEGGMMNDE